MADVQAPEGASTSLTCMFEQLQSNIEAKRCDNLFQQLESRTLTAEEEAVIQQRVAFQRKMFEEYEKREQKRKVEELQGMMPELTSEEAIAALELCNGNEDDAASQLTSDPSFLRHVRATLHGAAPAAERPRSSAAPVGPRPKRVDLSKLGDGVFVGSFRGKGYEHHQQHRRPAAAEARAAPADAQEAAQEEEQEAPADQEEEQEAAAAEEEQQAAAAEQEQEAAAAEEEQQAAAVEEAKPEHGSPDARPDRPSRAGDDPEATAATILAQRTPKAVASLRALDEAHREQVLQVAMDRAPQRGAALVAALFDALEGGDAAEEQQQDDDDSDYEVVPTRTGRQRASGALQAGRQGTGGPGSPEARRTRSRTPVAAKQAAGKEEEGRGKENQPAGVGTTPGGRRTLRVATASPPAKAPVEAVPVAVTEAPSRTASIGKGAQAPAISRTGHTNRGRVRQKSSKSAELVEIGRLIPKDGWFNSGYIFPAGFMSRIIFRSSVHLDQLCVHECSILGEGGKFWPKPTFQVVAMDRPDEPLTASSCTGCWTAILKRINAEIEARRRAGEDLPPPPKTAIAGPEYFGLNQAEAIEAIEALDPEQRCQSYWVGKQQREAAAAGLLPAGPPRDPSKKRAAASGGVSRAPKRGRKRATSESEDEPEDGDAEEAFIAGRNNWSAVSRADRYRKRRAADGEEVVDDDNPLPEHIDPITLEPVVCPAISPYGHVMGMATWKAVLEESEQCPFTKQPLRVVQLKKLTKANIDSYRDIIVK